VTDYSRRERLVQSLEAARVKEAALLALCDDSPPVEEGGWTVRDNVAHLSTWREHAVRTLDAIRLGKPMEGPANESDLDVRNAEIYETHKGDSAAQVREAHAQSYAALIEAVRACSEEDLVRERPDNGGEAWLVVPGNGHAHVAQHLSYLAADNGDPAGAESAAKWAYTLDTELFPEEKPVADYNFACFYARTGHADEALPLLQASLRSRPDLRRFALEDADFAPIRDDPRVQSLLRS
jgi:tetratricopeptide (TPR) repeat protein